jgi:hypothetical protein
MKGKVYIPPDFELYSDKDDDIFLVDEYGEVKEHVKEAIYLKPLFTHLYADGGTYCVVWWNDELGYWCGEIYVNWEYEDTYIYESLEELADAFSANYDPE